MSTAQINLGSSGGVSLDTLERLKSDLVVQLGGLPYLFARASYGNELTLHFGTERRYRHPKLAGGIRGTHVLSVRGSAWLLLSGVKPVMVGCGVTPAFAPPSEVKPFNVTALESGALIGLKARVKSATPFVLENLNAIGLGIEMDDGSRFMVLPTPPTADGDDLPEPADWEVLTPDRVLRIGPGPNYIVEKHAPYAG